jgi:hypothetical protein
MDWVPVAGDPSLSEDDPFLLLPQRFPGLPTAPESVLGGTSLDGSDVTFGDTPYREHTQREDGLGRKRRDLREASSCDEKGESIMHMNADSINSILVSQAPRH